MYPDETKSTLTLLFRDATNASFVDAIVHMVALEEDGYVAPARLFHQNKCEVHKRLCGHRRDYILYTVNCELIHNYDEF